QHHFVYSQSPVGDQYLTACGEDDRKVLKLRPQRLVMLTSPTLTVSFIKPKNLNLIHGQG
ncbi:hypothetical protein ACXWOO_11870, partial [Streptococcus pyogenes]